MPWSNIKYTQLANGEEYLNVRADRESGSPAGRLLTRRVREGRFTERGVKHAYVHVSFVRFAPVTARLRQTLSLSGQRLRSKVVPRSSSVLRDGAAFVIRNYEFGIRNLKGGDPYELHG